MATPFTLRWILLICLPLSLFAASTPHLTRANRFIDTIDGIEFEYSPGQEALLPQMAARFTAWNRELAASPPPAGNAPLPLSAADMRQHRTEILQQIACEIGLDQPTPIQGEAYDCFLSYYEKYSAYVRLLAEQGPNCFQVHQVNLWERSELVRRLEAGEKIPQFSYDPVTKSGMCNFGFKIDPDVMPQELQKTIAQQRLDHRFNYRVENGVAHLSAGFSLKPSTKTTAPFASATPPATTQTENTDIHRAVPVVFLANNPEKTPDASVVSY
jgi:hypothetical protein